MSTSHSNLPARSGMPVVNLYRMMLSNLIEGETIYLQKLVSIDRLYGAVLREASPSSIPRHDLEKFIQDTFHNIHDVIIFHRNLLDVLQGFLHSDQPNIESVMAAFHDAIVEARGMYIEYISHVPVSLWHLDSTLASSSELSMFLKRQADASKSPLRDLMQEPIHELHKYIRLLQRVQTQYVAEGSRVDLVAQALKATQALSSEAERGFLRAQERTKVWQYAPMLELKSGEMMDLDLQNEARSLLHMGQFWYRSDAAFTWNALTELVVFVFDHYLVITNPKHKDGTTSYQLFLRPILLDLLTLGNFTEPPRRRSVGVLPFKRRTGSLRAHRALSDSTVGQDNHDSQSDIDGLAFYPCTLHHVGRLGGTFTFYVKSAQARNEWREKLEEAVSRREAAREFQKVFTTKILADEFMMSSQAHEEHTPSLGPDRILTGKVNCSVPLITSDGRRLTAVGCDEGLWIGYYRRPKTFRHVLHLKRVTQCAVLVDFAIFLVLSDHTLIAYHLESLVPSAAEHDPRRGMQKLNSNNVKVVYFHVGTIGGCMYLIYAHKRGNETIFCMLEPIPTERRDVEETLARSVLAHNRYGAEMFKIFREFRIPTECFSVTFLRRTIAISCKEGFEIVNVDDFTSITIPQQNDTSFPLLAQRRSQCRPLGMFRTSEDEHLLCYNDFGLHVDHRGIISRETGPIEWEGTAEQAACHPPYVLLFNPHFVEIRHLDTGRLIQIIRGNDVRCLCDGLQCVPYTDERYGDMARRPRLHVIMNEERSATRRKRLSLGGDEQLQHVFELKPTVPAYSP